MILLGLASIQVARGGCRLEGLPQQMHVNFWQRVMAFASIAGRASCHQILPRVRTTGMTRNDVIDREACVFLAAILTAIIIAAKDLALAQLHMRARAVDEIP